MRLPHRTEPRRYGHAFFDFDGVLCDSLAAAMRSFNALGAQYPVLPQVSTQNDMVEVYGGSLKTCLSRWLAPAQHSEFFDQHSALMARMGSELDLFRGASALLNGLPSKSASLVTSAYGDHVRAVLSRACPAVDPGTFYAIAGREVRATKTTKIQGLAAELDLNVDDCVYVGDLESDILYCRAVPIDIIAVTYGYHPRWHLESCQPTLLVDSVGELKAVLERTLVDGQRIAANAREDMTHVDLCKSPADARPSRVHIVT